jgi:hypothetical protein
MKLFRKYVDEMYLGNFRKDNDEINVRLKLRSKTADLFTNEYIIITRGSKNRSYITNRIRLSVGVGEGILLNASLKAPLIMYTIIYI